MSLMLLFAAAILAADPPPRPASAVAQAMATVRIVRAVTLKLDGSTNEDAPAPRTAMLTSADGTHKPVKLIEFQ